LQGYETNHHKSQQKTTTKQLFRHTRGIEMVSDGTLYDSALSVFVLSYVVVRVF